MNTSSIKQVKQMYKCALSQKPGVFIILPLIHNRNLKNSVHNSKDIYEEKLVTKFNKLSWWALFTTAFWLETILDNVRDKSVKVNT